MVTGSGGWTLRELKHQRAVIEASLDIPDDVLKTAVRELLDDLHERSSVYAGPVPAGDRGLYKEWMIKREAFEFAVVKRLYRTLESGGEAPQLGAVAAGRARRKVGKAARRP